MAEGQDENITQLHVAQPDQPSNGRAVVAPEAETDADDLDIGIQPTKPIGNIQIEGQWHSATPDGREEQQAAPQPTVEPTQGPENINENPNLIEQLDESQVNPVQIPPEILQEFLKSYSLPRGATIEELQMVFEGQICKVSGKINVPILIVGGSVDFNFDLQNDQSGKMAASEIEMTTRSAVLQRQLNQVRDKLGQIDQFLLSDLNPKLTKNQITSISLGEGVFLFNMQSVTTEPQETEETVPPQAAAEVRQPAEPEEHPDQLLEEEKKAERKEVLTDLINEFAELSEEDLKQYNAFREKTRGEKIKSALKGFGRRAAVYAAFGVGAYAFLHLAPVAIVAGAAAGLGGSTLSRGVVDMVKWASGAEKKEQALQSQISGKQMEKLGNLMALATRVKEIEAMPGQQAMNLEKNQIVTLEEAKFNFVKAIVDFNNRTAAGNPEIEGLKKKYEKSRKGWGVAKTVASIVGGVVAGGLAAAEFKSAVVNKIAEKGLEMHGQGLGEIAPQAAHEHFVHLHQGEVVFNYNPGDLNIIGKAIEAKPELAQIFSTTSHTKELIDQGMHQAGEQLSQRFAESVNEVANARIAEFVVGAATTAEAADRVWKAISPGRSEGEKYLDQSSKYGKENLEQYQSDLQADINASANERFQAIFIGQPGVMAENMPTINQIVPAKIEINLTIPQADGPEKELKINPGENLQIIGVDQNGNIGVIYEKDGQLLTFTKEDFFRYVLVPAVEVSQEEASEGEIAEEEVVPAKKEETPPQAETPEESPEEKELKELKAGNPYQVTIKKFENEKDNEFHAELKGRNRKLIFGKISADIAPKAGEKWEIEIEANRGNNNILEVKAIRKIEETRDEGAEAIGEETLKRFEAAMQPGAVWKFDPLLVGKFSHQNEYGFSVAILSGKEEEKFFKLQYYQSCKIDSEPYRNEAEDGKVYINLRSPDGKNLYAAEFDQFIKFMSPEFVTNEKNEGPSNRFNKWARDYVKNNIEGEIEKPAAGEPLTPAQEPTPAEEPTSPPAQPAAPEPAPAKSIENPTPAAPPAAPPEPLIGEKLPVEQQPPQEPPQIGPLPQAEPPEPAVEPAGKPPEEPLGKYTFSKEGESPIEIQAGQKWRFKKDNWDTGNENIITAWKLVDTDDGEKLEISFESGRPVTTDIKVWDQIFRRAELIE